MAQLLIRKLDAHVVEGLKAKAAAHGQSLEQEVRDILAASIKFGPGERRAAADRLRQRTVWIPGTDSTDLVRTQRDR
jgi:antitoxin FitA